MKSKNKLTNNFNLISKIKNVSANLRNNKYINPAIIILILGFSIYLLYFNDKIYVQDSITNSLTENNNTNSSNDVTCENSDQDNFVENFNTNKYLDICKYRNTRFYNLTTSNLSTSNLSTSNFDFSNNGQKSLSECENRCDICSCDVYTLSGQSCYTYTRKTNPLSLPIKINCDSFVMPSSYGAGSYNGIGYVNKNYFRTYNKTDISYIDPFLTESIDVLDRLYKIDTSRNVIRNLVTDTITSTDLSTNYHANATKLLAEEKNLFRRFDTTINSLFDNSRNIIYTDMYNQSDISNTILVPKARDSPFVTDLYKKYNEVTKSFNLDSILDVKSENFEANNIRYLILAFIMVITIIILILYKSSNLINEKILIAYIISVSFLVLFLTQQLKL